MKNEEEKLKRFDKGLVDSHSLTLKEIELMGVQHGVGNVSLETVHDTLDSIRSPYNLKKEDLLSLTKEIIRPIERNCERVSTEINSLMEKKRLDPMYKQETEKKIRQKASQKLEKLTKDHIGAKRGIQGEVGFSILESDFKDVTRRFEEKAREVGRISLDSFLSRTLSYFLIFILMFLEVPFSFSAFLVLKTLPIVSVTIAILVACVLALASHFAGAAIKTKKNRAIPIILIVFGLAVVQVTAHFRTVHANGDQITSQFFYPEDTFFLIIGVMIFLVCISISYLSHDSNPEFEKLYRSHEEIKADYIGTKEDVEERLSMEDQKFKDEKVQLEKWLEKELAENENTDTNKLVSLEDRLDELDNAKITEFERCSRVENKIETLYGKAISKYLNIVESKRSVKLNGNIQMPQPLKKVLVDLKSL